MKKLLIYMKSVYQIPQKIQSLTDNRQRKSIPHFNVVLLVLTAMLLQYESFHTVFSAPESMKRRLKHLVKGRIPKVDAVRDVLTRTSVEEVTRIYDSVIRKIRRNGVQRSGTIGKYTVAAIDGVELFTSTKKSCSECLSRENAAHKTEYFHRSVVCASVGGSPHIIYGQTMLKPRDGAQKDEGELTGGKRLIRELWRKHGHFADVIVADALYLNAPFINTVLECKMDVVIRLKDEGRIIFKEAQELFSKGHGQKESFQQDDVEIDVWDMSGFEMKDVPQKVRVIKYREKWCGKNGKEESREMWLVTTLTTADYKLLWKIMHKRWDIEENAFHQLKTYYHAKHCYCHKATEVIFLLMLIAFNMRELYLFRRLREFPRRKITRKSVTRIFRDNLLLEDFRAVLYDDSG